MLGVRPLRSVNPLAYFTYIAPSLTAVQYNLNPNDSQRSHFNGQHRQ